MTDDIDIFMGHNSVDKENLKTFVKRILAKKAEQAELVRDVKDLFTEAVAKGFDRKTMNEMMKLVQMDESERDEREELRAAYASALGLFG